MPALQHRAAQGGFAAPVFGAQAVFGAVMNAFARPGVVVDLGGFVAAPPPLPPAAAAVLAALADFDTPIWLDAPLRAAPEPAAWLTFQTGAPLTEVPGRAAFAVLSDAAGLAAIERFPVGTAEYPDRSATLIVATEGLEGGPPLALAGPGIETTRTIAPKGLPATFLAIRRHNHGLFPRGIDLLLVDGSKGLALPRTTRVREA